MSLQVKLIAALVGLILALAGAGGLWIKAYASGNKAGQYKVRQEWDSATRQAEAENKATREEGFKLAADLEAQLRELEVRYAATDDSLRRALRRPATCPKSGEIGDVLLPADLVDSMFNRQQSGHLAPGPSASKPSR